MIKGLEAEKEPTIDKVISEICNLRDFVNNPTDCGYGIGFARELKTQVEIRFPDKGTDRI